MNFNPLLKKNKGNIVTKPASIKKNESFETIRSFSKETRVSAQEKAPFVKSDSFKKIQQCRHKQKSA